MDDPIRPQRSSRPVVARFVDVDDARDALDALHHAGFPQPWLGVVIPGDAGDGDALVRGEHAGGLLDAIERFFTRTDDDGHVGALRDALVREGLDEPEAALLASAVLAGDCIMTVDAEADVAEAATIVEDRGGRVVRAGEAPPGSERL